MLWPHMHPISRHRTLAVQGPLEEPTERLGRRQPLRVGGPCPGDLHCSGDGREERYGGSLGRT
jgi:hypothetical protein